MGKALKTAGAIIGGAVLIATGVGALAGLQVTAMGIAGVGTMSVGSLQLVSAGLTAVGSMLDKPTSQSAAQPTQLTKNADQPIPFLFGRMGVAGKILHDDEFGPDNMYRGLVGMVSGAGPIRSFVSFKGDDQTVTFDANGRADSSQWEGEMWMRYRLGAQPDVALTSPIQLKNNAVLPGWTASHRLSGKACFLQVLGENSKGTAYPGGMPDPVHVAEGLFGYDPRYDSTYPGGAGTCRLNDRSTWRWIDNPIIAGLNWALGMKENGKVVGGLGVSVAGIDLPAFVEAANIADANAWKIAAWPDTSEDAFEVLKQMLQAGGASYSRLAGKVSCVSRGAPKASIVTITARDTAGPIELDTGSSQFNRINTLTPRFMSEAGGWQLTPTNPVTFASLVTEDGGERSDGVDYRFVPAATQAGQLAAFDILDAREPFSGTVPLKPHLRRLKPGDTFDIDEPGFLLDGVKCIVISRGYDPAEGLVRVAFRSETDGKHDLALGKTTTMPSFPTLTPADPTLVSPPDPGAWTFEPRPPAPDGTQFPVIDVVGEFDNLTADAMVVSWRVVQEGEVPEDQPDPEAAGWVSAGQWPPSTTRLSLQGMPSGSVFWVAIRYRRGSNYSLPSFFGPFTAQTLIANPNDGSGDTTPPDVPTGLTVSSTSTINTATGQPIIKIIATWNAVTADDLDHYDVEITQGGFTILEWAGPDASPRFERPAVTGAVYTVRVRAVDTAGNASDWTAGANVTGAGDTVAPPAPTGLTTAPSLGGIYVRGNSPSVNDLARIDVYENTSNTTSGATRVAQLAAASGGSWSFTRAGLAAGQTRWFFAKAVDTSGNESGFSSGVSGTVVSVTTADFASGLTAPFLAANNAAASAAVLAATGSSSSAGYVYLNTTDRKLYRGTGGNNWTVATDGADITANTVTGGVFLAGAISAREIGSDAIQTIHLGARVVTAINVAVGTLTGDLVAANTLEGSVFKTNTALPGTITVGTTGVTIATVQSYANDPASRINSGPATLIDPGKILIAGGSTLASWRGGPDNTEINGGKLATNSVRTQSLEVGARGLTFAGFNFSTSGNTLSWIGGEAIWTDDNGVPQSTTVSAGSANFSGSAVFVYWQKGATTLGSTTTLSSAMQANRVLIVAYYGGGNFTATYGRTIIDENGIVVPTLAAIAANLGNITAGNINMVAGTRRLRINPGFGPSGNMVFWVGPTSVPTGSETVDNGLLGISTDDAFFGGRVVSGPFDSGAPSSSLLTISGWTTVATVASRTMRNGVMLMAATWQGTLSPASPAPEAPTYGLNWRLYSTNQSGGDGFVVASGFVDGPVNTANVPMGLAYQQVTYSGTGNRRLLLQLSLGGDTTAASVRSARVFGLYAADAQGWSSGLPTPPAGQALVSDNDGVYLTVPE